MRKNHKKEPANLLTLRPLAVRESEAIGPGREDILIPRFGNHVLGRWLMKRSSRPYHRLHLDEVGTFIWKRLDGNTSVKVIGESLIREFGEQVEPVFDRLGLFIGQLDRAQVIQVRERKEG